MSKPCLRKTLIDKFVVLACLAPSSLPKLLSTSDDVLRQRKNFDCTMQRHASRSRPLTRIARRWNPIWTALSAEAATNSPRRETALYVVRDLTGANSHRLVFAEMLTDISSVAYRSKRVRAGRLLEP